MQLVLVLDLLEALPADSAGSVWATLDDSQRDDVVAVLARLIANAAAAPEAVATMAAREPHDERHI